MDDVVNHRLKCDAAGCDYEEPAPMPGALSDLLAHVGKPCPKCGASLMTKEDAEAAWCAIELIHQARTVLADLGIDLQPDDGSKGLRVSVNPRAASLNVKMRLD